MQGDRFLLNSRPYLLRMVLDQGYWPDGGMTAPDDEALRRDVELAREMGFNGVRKHQKIEDPRYLYWADVLGLAVWEEMPSAYRFTPRRRWSGSRANGPTRSAATTAIRASSRGCRSTNRGACRTCPTIRAERHYVQALYHLTKTLDATRPVIGNDGWESVATDIIGIHDYDDRAGAHRASATMPTKCCRGCSSASGPAAGCSCSKGTRTPISR